MEILPMSSSNSTASSLIPLSRGSFDVLVGIDRLSKRKFGIVCHGKVVRIPLEGDEILRVHGERTQGVVKTLMNTKVGESKLSDLVPGATPVAKSPYRLAPLEMQELSEQLQELQDEELELLRKEKLYAKVVRIPLEGDEILQVHGERTQGVVKTLINTKHGVHFKLELELLRKEKLYAKVTYLRFIANFSKVVKPITSLTERDQKYE
ncbi:hypothetical protein Tco_1532834 [Tanacetum coccineum]